MPIRKMESIEPVPENAFRAGRCHIPSDRVVMLKERASWILSCERRKRDLGLIEWLTFARPTVPDQMSNPYARAL